MRHYILLVSVALLGAISTQAQTTKTTLDFFMIENGVNFSSFDLSHSDSTSAFVNGDYSPQQHNAIKIGSNIYKGLSIVLGGAFDKHQIMGGQIDSLNTHFSYDINYLSANVELQYSHAVSTHLELIANAGLSANYLLSGFQNIGSQTFDLNDTNFEDVTTSYNLGISVLYNCSESLGLYIQYDNRMNRDMYESSESTETYFIHSHGLRIGARVLLATS